MKKYIFTGCICLWMSLAGYAQTITFSELEHNFGTIEEAKGDVSYDFHFTNTGDKPLLIKQVVTGCGCTSAEWNKTPYQPGEKGTIRLTYHPEGRSNEHFNLITEVYSNQKGITLLTISGTVNLKTHPDIGYFDPTKGKRATPTLKEPSDDFELILQRLREDLYKANPAKSTDSIATRLLMTMNADGKWADIDYACFFRTNWEPAQHLKQLETIALAYTNPTSTLYGNPIVFKAIQKGLDAWFKAEPESHNWWFNTISSPQSLANILALMQAGVEKLSPQTIQAIMNKKGNSDPRKWTGANKQDVAIHHLIRGCVLKNDSIVSLNTKEFFDPIRITNKEGIQKDLSYQQHGPQLYIGGYGIVFVSSIANTAAIFNNTKYALGKEQLELFSNFVRNTYLNVFRSHFMDFSVCGRSVSRLNTIDTGLTVDLLENMKKLDPSHAKEYDSVEQRIQTNNATIGRTNRNQLFDCSDYMLHNRKDFDFSVRIASSRTYRSESGNGENLWGTYVSEGATNIRVFGDEYLNIFPVWEWDKIPGTTTAAGEVRNPHDWGAYGNSDFVGGVSDGTNGVMTYAMDAFGVKAHKAWFLFDNEIICLGAGISSTENKQINTTINQCNLSGDVYLTTDQNTWETLAEERKASRALKGKIWHHQVGYYFPERTKIQVKNTQQTGNWSKINFNEKDEPISMPVFNLSINHGVRPNNATYAYALVPGMSKKDFDSYIPSFKIECNNTDIQAVSRNNGDDIQAVFYQAGTLKVNKKTIHVSTPCVVFIKNLRGRKPDIMVKDPTQKQNLSPTDVITIK